MGGTEAVEYEAMVNSPPSEVVSVPLTSVTEWQLRQSQLLPRLGAVTIPQSPSESVLCCKSEFPFSVMSLLE